MKHSLLTICTIVALLSDIASQAQFGPPEMVQSVPGSFQLSDLTAGDLNNDGFIDLFGRKTNRIGFYENEGEGQFKQASVLIQAPSTITRYVVFDSDNDGDLDILLSTSDEVLLYENEIVTASLVQTISGGAKMLELFDFNEDGFQDVVIYFGTSLSIYLNDGAGGLILSGDTDLSPFLYANAIKSMAFTDYNDDDHTDIIFTTAFSSPFFESFAAYMLNNGDNTFSAYVNLDAGTDIKAVGVKVVDFDVDGDEDILLLFSHLNYDTDDGCGVGESVLLLLEKADSAYYEQSDLVISIFQEISQLHVNDMNNDGFPDIVLNYIELEEYAEKCISYPYGAMVVFNNGDGTITDDVYYAPSGMGNNYSNFGERVVIADVSGNGFDDIVFSETGSIRPPIYVVNSGLTSGNNTESYYLYDAPNTKKLFTGELNGDNQTEILLWSKELTKDFLMTYDRTGSSEYISEKSFLNFCSSMDMGDFNGDGLSDMVFVQKVNSNHTVVVRINNGSGSWIEEIIFANNISKEVFASDLNNDGKAEVVVVQKNGPQQSYSIYSRTDSGTYEELGNTFTVQGWFASVSFGDVNGDGFNDMSVIKGSNSILVLISDGNGAFMEEIILPYGEPTSFLQHKQMDLNQDGFADVVVWNESGSVSIRQFQNNGDGSFSNPINVKPAGTYNRFVAFGDLYNNGVPQMVFLSNTDELTWKDNDGNGNFGNEVTILDGTLATSAKYITMGDFNGDGATDIALARSSSGNLYSSSFIDEVLMLPSYIVPGTTVNGFVYFDENENGVFDEGDLPASYIPVGVVDNDALTYSLPNGQYFIANLTAGPVSITPMLDEILWTVTSSPAVYEIELTEDNNYSASNIDFGIAPLVAVDSLSLDLSFGNLRCNESFVTWITIENNGTTAAPSLFTVNIDPATEYLSSFPADPTIVGNTLGFEVPAILPFEQYQIQLVLLGPDEQLTGDTLDFGVVLSNLEGEVFDSLTYSSVVACAFDPNDKLESNGWTENGFVLEGGRLEYTIRFQNTGNDVAMNVRLEDELSGDLDWSTFEAVSWSHEPLIQLSSLGELVVFFSDIMLPDSGASWIDSQGYFKFNILPVANLPVGAVINNTAGIFFDFNEPVITNTTVNTIYSCEGLAEFTFSDETLCEGQEVELVSEQPWITAYNWSVNAEPSGTDSLLTLADLSAGSFVVMLVAENALCSETHQEEIDIFPNPLAPEIMQNESELFVENIFENYQWYFEGEVIEGANESAYMPGTNEGLYSVMVFSENGCSSDSETYLYIISSTGSLSQNNISVFPIPSTGVVYIDFGGIFAPDSRVLLTDLSGRILMATNINGSRLEWNLDQLSGGVYLLQLYEGGDLRHTRKILLGD